MHLIVLINFGPMSMPDKPNREWAQQRVAMLEDIVQHPTIDGEIHEVFWTLGVYDLVVHAEVKDQLAAHAFSLVVTRKLRANSVTLSALENSEIGPVFDVLQIKNGP